MLTCFSFNLMAVVPDRRIAITHKLRMLNTNKTIVTTALEKLLIAQGGATAKLETDTDAKEIVPDDDISIESEQDTADVADMKFEAYDATSVEQKTIDDAQKEENILRRLSMQSQCEAANDDATTDNGEATEERAAIPALETNAFSIKDLSTLLKNLESGIALNEQHLNDENEKRRMFMVDDCRRVHNYDQFICTFLSMLAQQGILAELVSQQMSVSRRSFNSFGNQNGRVGRMTYKRPAQRTTTAGKRRRGRNKGTRRK